MDTATIKAVLLGTPGMNNAVRDVLYDPATKVSWAVSRINELLEEYGWDVRVGETLVRDLYDDLNPTPPTTMQWVALDLDESAEIVQQEESTKVSIKTVTYINGMDMKDMTVEQFLTAIKTTDKEIKRLEEMGIESATVDKQIAQLKTDKAQLIEMLDQQHSDD